MWKLIVFSFRVFFFSTATLFTLKKSERQEELEEDEDEFQTDDDDMEVSEAEEEKQAVQKRKKVFSSVRSFSFLFFSKGVSYMAA